MASLVGVVLHAPRLVRVRRLIADGIEVNVDDGEGDGVIDDARPTEIRRNILWGS